MMAAVLHSPPLCSPSMHHASHRADSLAFHRATPSAVMRENSIVASLRFANLQPHLQRSGTALHRGFVGERAEKERTQPMYTKKVYVSHPQAWNVVCGLLSIHSAAWCNPEHDMLQELLA